MEYVLLVSSSTAGVELAENQGFFIGRLGGKVLSSNDTNFSLLISDTRHTDQPIPISDKIANLIKLEMGIGNINNAPHLQHTSALAKLVIVFILV